MPSPPPVASRRRRTVIEPPRTWRVVASPAGCTTGRVLVIAVRLVMAGIVGRSRATRNPRKSGIAGDSGPARMGLVLPRAKDYNRVGRQIEVALARAAFSGDEAIETIVDASADLLGISGSCWHLTDPSSGLPIADAMLGDPAGSFEESLIYEFRRPDLSRFDELRG